jgi:hypothetical protein
MPNDEPSDFFADRIALVGNYDNASVAAPLFREITRCSREKIRNVETVKEVAMIKDGQARKLRRLLAAGDCLAVAARRTGMDEKTARKYRESVVRETLEPGLSKRASTW